MNKKGAHRPEDLTINVLFGGKKSADRISYEIYKRKFGKGINRCSECSREAKENGVCPKRCSDARKKRQSGKHPPMESLW